MADTPEERFARPHYLIRSFTEHRLASNLLMIMLILAGIWGTRQLNTHLNPHQTSRTVEVNLIWPGAPAEDVERLVTEPVELQLRALSGLTGLTSRTVDGSTRISVEFSKATELGEAIDRVEQQIALTRDLPSDLESPNVQRSERHDLVGAILLSGKDSLADLVPVALQDKLLYELD